ncbi:coil containing protein [Vibrio phage 1.204.O._10N.222.46.F12]|uniref:Coil containing protein n=1 Tax=Vibrio phage 1.204.O._10N.222.46.F12 TaxID=1881263 RepID=A0A2I7RNM9_9CAUD|nr:coil containing protein [Vibrio phage 1.204.O._10N.222.46.F12]AUR95263.1 coil containing protein [Vibrio phage 1.204.O._10N.222.46.F12]
MLTVKVLSRLADLALSVFVKLNATKASQKVALGKKLQAKAKAAASNTAAVQKECKDEALNLEIALTEEIAALEQRYDLKHQAIEQKLDDAKAIEFKIADKYEALDNL